jgi:hypothetical protein
MSVGRGEIHDAILPQHLQDALHQHTGDKNGIEEESPEGRHRQ